MITKLLATFFVAAMPFWGAALPGCDLALISGKLWTENKLQPEAEAIAINGDRIVSVGNNAEIKALIGSNTHIIDLKGRRVLTRLQ